MEAALLLAGGARVERDLPGTAFSDFPPAEKWRAVPAWLTRRRVEFRGLRQAGEVREWTAGPFILRQSLGLGGVRFDHATWQVLEETTLATGRALVLLGRHREPGPAVEHIAALLRQRGFAPAPSSCLGGAIPEPNHEGTKGRADGRPA